jgi:tight adherence protein B
MEAVARLLIGLACLAAVFTIVSYLLDNGNRRVSQRARRIGNAGRGKRQVAGPRLKVDTNGVLDVLVRRVLRRPEALRARLAASGTGLSIGRYGLICLIVAISVTILAVLRGLAPPTALVMGLICGYKLPQMAVESLINRRRARFYKLFPEAIALIVRGLRAGLPFGDTLGVVAREVANPVGMEFRRMSEQLSLGQSIEEAMLAVARRLGLPEFNFLITTLSVQRETGGNLAETLEIFEDMLRKREQMRLKVRAMSSEAKASAGIIGSLPFVMMGLLYFVSHDYVMQLFTTHIGHLLLVAGGTSLTIGAFVMSRMVRFDI